MDRKSDESCTVEDLLDLVRDEGGFTLLPDRSMDQVYPGIYIGDERSAKNRFLLRQEGITHILNVAKGSDEFSVDSDTELLEKLDISWLDIEAKDNDDFPIETIIDKTTDFIEKALQAGGKVLVHCRAGVSRSATVVLAFLMLKRDLTVREAVQQVHRKRAICPNDGFLRQLCELNKRLEAERHGKKHE